jgi:dihydroneopterin aldolase
MEQMGLALAEMHPRLVPARSLADIEAALSDAKIPVWLPYELLRGARDIPEDWDMTSDSLSAWLAGRVGASSLLLIKQTDQISDSLQELAGMGVVDRLLPQMLGGSDLHIAGPQALANAGRMLAAGGIPGAVVGKTGDLARGAA